MESNVKKFFTIVIHVINKLFLLVSPNISVTVKSLIIVLLDK